MRESVLTGASFGLTSGVITTLGLIVGLHAGTESRLAVVGGVITIAIADALSDALGIHIAEESRDGRTSDHIWSATIATFVSKFLMAATFLIPFLLLPLDTAVIVCVVWGLAVVVLISERLAAARGESRLKTISEHLLISVVVILVTHAVGIWVAKHFH
jgi:VIT1/CCC1 family predicted Fe2+/Mn2+ transporter